MSRSRQYMVLILVGIFSIPQIYQNAHILGHKTKPDKVRTDPLYTLNISAEGSASCIVCNFEFPVSDFSGGFFYQLFIAVAFLHFVEPVLIAIKKFNGYSVFLRAPPSIL